MHAAWSEHTPAAASCGGRSSSIAPRPRLAAAATSQNSASTREAPGAAHLAGTRPVLWALGPAQGPVGERERSHASEGEAGSQHGGPGHPAQPSPQPGPGAHPQGTGQPYEALASDLQNRWKRVTLSALFLSPHSPDISAHTLVTTLLTDLDTLVSRKARKSHQRALPAKAFGPRDLGGASIAGVWHRRWPHSLVPRGEAISAVAPALVASAKPFRSRTGTRTRQIAVPVGFLRG